MKNIIVFDTSSGSFNMGDYIINECATKELKKILDNNFCIRIGTHNPVAHFYQLSNKRKKINFINKADLKLLIGTNILKKNMMRPWPDWNINLFNSAPYKDTILVGIGLDGNFEKTNLYTTKLYQKILNKNYYHATRDEKTKQYLENIGLKAINTGCPTLWGITEEICQKIPEKKSDSVVFTLTDYAKSKEKDQELINILQKNYKNIYLWIQGSGDYNYFKTLKNIKKIKIINPNIESYDKFLNENNVDYVGTRLHAGIYAIRHMKRSIIIAVDNRAKDMNETYKLNVIDRTDISKLDAIINSCFKTKIKINYENIRRWKAQFK